MLCDNTINMLRYQGTKYPVSLLIYTLIYTLICP